jgi:hypothetical protein
MKQNPKTSLVIAGLLLGGITLTGCMKDKEPTPTAVKAPAKVMTHYLTTDQPCYMKPGAESCGTLKKGTKLLVVIPGSMPQVETEEGKTLYTKIDGIEAIEVPAPPKPAAPATKPVAVAKPVVTKGTPATPAKEMTHMLTSEQPYYAAMPIAADAKPAGTLPKGTKVLLLIPGSYCQVETVEGKAVYTKIDGVDLISAK